MSDTFDGQTDIIVHMDTEEPLRLEPATDIPPQYATNAPLSFMDMVDAALGRKMDRQAFIDAHYTPHHVGGYRRVGLGERMRMISTAALLQLNPELQSTLHTRPHNVCLILMAFWRYRWLLQWRSAEARAAWRALPDRLRQIHCELMADVYQLQRADEYAGLDLGDGDLNTELAYRICRLFGTFLVLPVRDWSAERQACRDVSVIH